MSYNTDLQSNNTDLQSILDLIQALPEGAKPGQTKIVTPSLSEQTIAPDSGKSLSSVQVSAITKELLANLDSDFIADNIAKDIDLFGLVGTLEASAGGFAYGTITPADTTVAQIEIEHGLGAIPDFIAICAANDKNSVYTRSTPYGQSFIYAKYVSTNNGYRRYAAKHQYTSSLKYDEGNISSTIGSGLAYYLALSDTSIIWPNRNTSYGFGKYPAPFLWIAIKEISA